MEVGEHCTGNSVNDHWADKEENHKDKQHRHEGKRSHIDEQETKHDNEHPWDAVHQHFLNVRVKRAHVHERGHDGENNRMLNTAVGTLLAGVHSQCAPLY